MTAKLALVGVPVIAPPTARTWLEHVQSQLLENWLPGQWDAQTGVLRVDAESDDIGLDVCNRLGCTNPTPGRFCTSCRSHAEVEGLPLEVFALRPKPAIEVPDGGCIVETPGGRRCQRHKMCQGLCKSHYHLLQRYCVQNDIHPFQVGLADFLATPTLKALAAVPCQVPLCSRSAEERSGSTGLCPLHMSVYYKFRNRDGRNFSRSEWIARYSDAFFSPLVVPIYHLQEPIRSEFLFIVQQYLQHRLGRIYPEKLRSFIRDVRLTSYVSLQECLADDTIAQRLKGFRTFGLDLLQQQERRFNGHDPKTADLIYLQDLPLRQTATARNPSVSGEPLRMSMIAQPWLADAFRTWLTVTLDTRKQAHLAFDFCRLASETLAAACADNGHDPSRLGSAEMGLILASARTHWTWDVMRQRLPVWWALCAVARRHRIWDTVPLDFSRELNDFRLLARDRSQQKVESDRVTPTVVIAHLRNHTDLFAEGRFPDMYRCILELLIDTGRRPGEIVTLRTNCLVKDRHGDWLLQYTDHKNGEVERELPVDQSVVDSIDRWNLVRRDEGITSDCLFPRLQYRRRDVGSQPVDPHYLAKLIKLFAATIPPLPGSVEDVDGNNVDFDITTVEPYDLRRAYAQRHADCGTPPDVLRVLMGHKSMTTTMGYYQVNAKRRRQAVTLVGRLALLPSDGRAGLAGQRDLIRATPVPYGDCMEPSNVSAGGTACPWRYQCASCALFRPNPSHIPEMEKDLIRLRSQLAVMERTNTADYLLSAVRGLISDYGQRLAEMRQQLSEMPPERRKEIENMSEILRRSRVAAMAGRSIEIQEV